MRRPRGTPLHGIRAAERRVLWLRLPPRRSLRLEQRHLLLFAPTAAAPATTGSSNITTLAASSIAPAAITTSITTAANASAARFAASPAALGIPFLRVAHSIDIRASGDALHQ